jgi:PQQ-dependent catabolism-associated CXXCW motif protein
MRWWLAWALAAALPAAAAAQQVPEPEGYRMATYRAPPPATLAGARVVGVEEAYVLWRDGAVFVDVLPLPPRPESLPEGTLWRVPGHDTVQGATWLPNTGFGTLAPDVEAYLFDGLAEARGGGAEPVVFFCKRDCWMSWNVARRVVAADESGVVWFPDGTDGWIEAGLPVETAVPRDGYR